MFGSRRRSRGVAAAAIALTSLFASAPGAVASGATDQQHEVQRLAAELVSLNDRIAIIDEQYGAAQDQQVAVAAQIDDVSAKVAVEQSQLDALEVTMTSIAVDRFVGHNTFGLSPLFSSAVTFSQGQQFDALSSVAYDTGAGTADDVKVLVTRLEADQATLRRDQKASADLIASLAAARTHGEQLIADYTKKAADAQAKYGELVQQEADRQAAVEAQKAAQAADAAQAAADRLATRTTVPPNTAPAPRGGGPTPVTVPVTVPTTAPRTTIPSVGPATTPPTVPRTTVPRPGTPPTTAPPTTKPPTTKPPTTVPPTTVPPTTKPPVVTTPPPPVSGKAAIAVAAARSMLGVPYVAFEASPSRGFDCSGLTMWVWAQAGVHLPHQSGQQYASNPHVAKTDAQPGDLVFFYSPIHHVGIYIGGGLMIDAPHTGAVVRIATVKWDQVVGVARPG